MRRARHLSADSSPPAQPAIGSAQPRRVLGFPGRSGALEVANVDLLRSFIPTKNYHRPSGKLSCPTAQAGSSTEIRSTVTAQKQPRPIDFRTDNKIQCSGQGDDLSSYHKKRMLNKIIWAVRPLRRKGRGRAFYEIALPNKIFAHRIFDPAKFFFPAKTTPRRLVSH